MNYQLHVVRRYSGLGRAVFVATLSLTAFNVSAAPTPTDDKVDFFVAERVTTDSNVFRVANNRQSDTHSTTTAGLNVDKTISRQRFLAGASLDLVRYNRFSDLNHLGRNARALWLWELGNQWSGQLGYAERKALGSFSNIPGRSTNNLKIQRLHADAAYMLTPSWQLFAGVAQQAQRNSDQAREVNDVDLRTLQMAANFITPARNKFGVGVTQDDGQPLHRQTVGGASHSNAYTQRAIDVHTDWALTGKSHLKARLAQVQRDYDELSYRDYDGTTLHVTYDWQATGKLALSVLAQRDISPDEDLQTSFVLIKGIAFRPSYALSEKVKLMANADFSTRDYLGSVAAGPTAGRSDRVRLLSATASYQPMRSLTLLLSGQRESRSSNIANYDYKANVLNLSGRFTF
ncbi:MAG: XrtB/PEP-CTERM-associated polysaccharide biosynthesis outer membrane protein EpsL [Rhodocyclaceae bacterium]|nr:XrtB/PEP-CTERM-associated polysaccharide biosynthesis outer membrane protein EpsL [Rhodocyclaceae bacterium]